MDLFTETGSWKTYLEQTCIPWRLLGWFVLVILALVIVYFALPMSGPFFTSSYGVISVLYLLIMGLLCFKGAPQLIGRAGSLPPGKQSGRRFSPALLGAGMLSFTLGQLIWAVQIVLAHQAPPIDSISYFVSYAIYPFFIVAFLLLPARNLSSLSRLRILMDSLIIMVAVTTLCLYFFLAPLFAEKESLLARIIAGAYPMADLVLVFCLLLVTLRSGEQALYPVLMMLGLATSLIFIAHVVHLSELLNSAYNAFSPANLLWLPATLLIAAAAQTISNMLRKDVCSSDIAERINKQVQRAVRTRRWKMFFTPGLVLIFSVLIFILWKGRHQESFPGQTTILYVGGFILLMLVVLRQLVALYEVGVLQKRLQARNRSLNLAHTQLEQLATTDPLTGLPNHGSIVGRLNEVLTRAQATRTSCALIFMDIDHFKTINDRYGHPTGDEVLRQFATLTQACLPPGASLGRWGGEEFVAILPRRNPLEALRAAERVRECVEHHLFAGEKEKMSVTCSLGVASYPRDAPTRESLLMSADKAMYAAKRLGRNQVRGAQEPLVQALGMFEPEAEIGEEGEGEGLTVVESLSAALEARDRYTSQHSRRVAALALKLALMAGLSSSEAYVVSLGGLLHDIGKIAVPDEVLLKPGGLSEEERGAMAQHPVIGAKIIAQVPDLQAVATIVRAHHEHMNGSGYPDGLKGQEIPLGARIVAVADAYDALTTNRAYRPGRSPIEAIRVLLRDAGSQFDPQIVGLLVRLFSVVPHLEQATAA